MQSPGNLEPPKQRSKEKSQEKVSKLRPPKCLPLPCPISGCGNIFSFSEPMLHYNDVHGSVLSPMVLNAKESVELHIRLAKMPSHTWSCIKVFRYPETSTRLIPILVMCSYTDWGTAMGFKHKGDKKHWPPADTLFIWLCSLVNFGSLLCTAKSSHKNFARRQTLLVHNIRDAQPNTEFMLNNENVLCMTESEIKKLVSDDSQLILDLVFDEV